MLRLSRIIAVVTLFLFTASLAFTQQGGGSQFAQMREKYKYTFQLMSMVRHIGEIDKDPKYALSQGQAKQVLAVLQPLRSKPKLTQDQAKDALKNLKKTFNVNQLNAMARIKPGPRPGQGGMGQRRPGGPGGNSGPGRPGGNGARPRMDPNAMKDFNPFYTKASANDEFAKQRVKRWNEFFTDLQNKAKGVKKVSSKKPSASPAKVGKKK